MVNGVYSTIIRIVCEMQAEKQKTKHNPGYSQNTGEKKDAHKKKKKKTARYI